MAANLVEHLAASRAVMWDLLMVETTAESKVAMTGESSAVSKVEKKAASTVVCLVENLVEHLAASRAVTWDLLMVETKADTKVETTGES